MKSLWVTNLTNKSISISDLGIRVQPNQSLDVYRSRALTESEIDKSLESGDLKSTKLYISKAAVRLQTAQLTVFTKVFPREEVSAVRIEQKRFAELEDLMTSDSFDNLSDVDKQDMEQKLLAKKEEEMIAQMLEEEESK